MTNQGIAAYRYTLLTGKEGTPLACWRERHFILHVHALTSWVFLIQQLFVTDEVRLE
jgi:hypothetical protein